MSVHWSVGPSVRHTQVVMFKLKTRKTRILDAAVGIVSVWGVEGMVGVRLGVGCPCPPIRNDIVTPRLLFFSSFRLRAKMV